VNPLGRRQQEDGVLGRLLKQALIHFQAERNRAATRSGSTRRELRAK
jgi:hypothetical protein